MPKFFVRDNQIIDDKIVIVGEDVNHIKNVLRKSIGDKLDICNQDDSSNYEAEIIAVNRDKVECKILHKLDSDKEPKICVDVFQGLPKADKMELIIQKSVELGVHKIIPVEMKRCVVKLNEKDMLKKLQRWQKISEVAAKQCGRNIIPKINNVIKVQDICKMQKEYDIILVAYENEKDNSLKNELQTLKDKACKKINIGIVIGPEGGLEIDDVNMLKENDAKVITLGKRILRTETVALNMLSIIIYELES